VRLYTLTTAEAAATNALNAQRTNVLLILCDFGEYVGVDPDALRSPDYAPYLETIGGTYQEGRIVELGAGPHF
jgi:hypothetical protein